MDTRGYTCQMCGFGARDEDPFDPSRRVSLIIAPAAAASVRRGAAQIAHVICTNCDHGLRDVPLETLPPKPDRLELMRQLRRATVADQLHALQWLQGKFSKTRGPEG